jgi:hypothetical protein
MSKIILKNVRISFPSLFKKATYNGEETGFEGTFLINKEDQADQAEAIQNAIKDLIKTNLKSAKLQPDKICLRDGDLVEYDGYADHFSIKASSKKRPLVIDRDKAPLVEEDGRPYSGCYVNASIELWAQDNNYGKRINATLLAVQFFKDGEPFGDNSSGSLSDFDAFGDDDSDDIF